MERKAICRAALLALTGWGATLLIAGCAIEVPKSALPAFRLTPAAAASGVPESGANKRIETPAS